MNEETELRLMVFFRCQNPQCSEFEVPREQPITRTNLREMSQPESTDKFMCPRCGHMFVLPAQEKVNNLKMLDGKLAQPQQPVVFIST